MRAQLVLVLEPLVAVLPGKTGIPGFGKLGTSPGRGGEGGEGGRARAPHRNEGLKSFIGGGVWAGIKVWVRRAERLGSCGKSWDRVGKAGIVWEKLGSRGKSLVGMGSFQEKRVPVGSEPPGPSSALCPLEDSASLQTGSSPPFPASPRLFRREFLSLEFPSPPFPLRCLSQPRIPSGFPQISPSPSLLRALPKGRRGIPTPNSQEFTREYHASHQTELSLGALAQIFGSFLENSGFPPKIESQAVIPVFSRCFPFSQLQFPGEINRICTRLCRAGKTGIQILFQWEKHNQANPTVLGSLLGEFPKL